MEDTHRIEVPFSRDPPFNKWSFFAVFDGHSSKQIAKGAAANIVEALLSTTQFQEVFRERKRTHTSEQFGFSLQRKLRRTATSCRPVLGSYSEKG